MKSKLALFSVIVPCLWVLIASALAQSNGQQVSTSATISRYAAQGQSSSSANPQPSPDTVNSASTLVTDPDLIPRPADGAYLQAFTAYGHTNDWRVHNEEAAIAPIVHQLKEAKSDSEVEKIKAQLDAALEKAFAMRQRRHTREIEELEAKVKTLKELVAKRQEKRREIVANRREQILREAQGLGW
jgi:Xaa-Pro aminopeptidase